MADENLKTAKQGYKYKVKEIKNDLEIRSLQFKKEFEDSINCIQRVSTGKSNGKPTKSMLLVGGTGVGKSSLISTLINNIFDVRYTDNFRIKLFEKECEDKEEDVSQTEWITVYEFNHMDGMSIDYNLTIIDTPGLSDTRGLEYDKLMFEHLEMVLHIDKFCVDELHCVGIVTQASANRLTDKQKYIYDGCMRLFGKNVKDIIHIMLTFAADGSDPTVINALKSAGVHYVELHEFNNSSIFVSNNLGNRSHAKKGSDKLKASMNAMSWQIMNEGCQNFLEVFEDSTGISLTETTVTLEYRRTLHSRTMELEVKFLMSLDMVQNDSKDTQTSLRLSNIAPTRVEYKQKSLNCQVCKATCHKPCYGKNNCALCKELLKKGNYCHCKCEYYEHEREHFQYVNELYGQVEEATRKEHLRELIQSLVELRDCVKTLQDVALRPIPISMEEYLGNLIDLEDENNDEATKGKINILREIQREEKGVQNILKNERELTQLIHRLNLSCKVEKGTKTGCSIM